MSGGGKSSTSTSSVSIPPEVLARYNAVNARAEQVAQQPFTPYGGQFVAPLTQTQQAGIANVSQAAGAAQPYYQAAGTALLGGAAQAQPYYQAATQDIYGGQAAAAPLQTAAAQNIAGAQAAAQPYQGMATGFGLAGARQIAPGGLNVGAYMSPYTEAVAQPTYQALRQQQEQERQRMLGEQIRGGAFGGDRGRIAQANLAQQQNLATAQALGNIYQQGYGQALGAAQQQQGVALQAEQANRQAQQQAAQQFLGIGQQAFGQGAQTAQQQAALAQQLFGQGAQAAQTQQALGQGLYGIGAGVSQGLAGLGTGAQQAALQGGQAQLAAGTVEQQTQQAQNQALYNQFLQQQGYPFQVAQFLANIAMGTGALSGSTTTTTQPSSFFSDERLKHDIEPIGKTFDGQDIVRFKYKGEPGTRIGLVAQDVEKKHPEAVGLAGGYKTVDYDAATDEAAARAPRAYGGGLSPWDGSSMGGSVFREDAGQGFAAGGAPGGDDVLAQINALVNAHQGMFPYGKAGLYGGGMGKAGPYGSTLMQPGSQRLMTAPPVRQEPPYDVRQAFKDVEDISKMPQRIQQTYGGLKGALVGTPGSTERVTNQAGETVTRNIEPTSGMFGRAGEVNLRESAPARGYRELESGVESLASSFGGGSSYAGNARGGAIRPGLAMGGLPYNQAENEYVPEDISKPIETPKLQTAPQTQMKDQGLEDAKTAMQIATTVAALSASDRRLKDNIEPIGKLFDGQNVYRYNFKGDDKKQIGLMAQEVEKKYPDAVGLAPRKGFTRGGGLNVPEAYQSMIEEVARERGVPPHILGAVLQQESGFNPDATGRAGEIGLGQILPSTAARPGYGLNPVSQEDLRDPRRNIDFSASYIAARNPNVDWSNPVAAARALAANYNAGGDPNYGERIIRLLPNVTEEQIAEVRANQPNARVSTVQEGGLAPPQREGATINVGPPREILRREPKDFLQRAEPYLIPLLTGLGTMASSPSRYLGSAVLQGLMGAGQSYQQIQGALGEREKTFQETQRIAEQTGFTRAQAENLYNAMARGAYNAQTNMMTVYRQDGTLITIPYQEYLRRLASGETFSVTPPRPGMVETRVPVQPRAPEPPQQRPPEPDRGGERRGDVITPDPIFVSLPPPVVEQATRNAQNLIENPGNFGALRQTAINMRAEGRDPFDIAERDANRAARTRPERNLYLTSLSSLASNPGPTGAGDFQARVTVPAISYYNSVIDALPLPADIKAQARINPSQIADSQAIQKVIDALSQEKAGDAGQRALGALRVAQGSVPRQSNSPEAIAKLGAEYLIDSQRPIDFDNYARLYRRAIENVPNFDVNLVPLAARDMYRTFDDYYGNRTGLEKPILEHMLRARIPTATGSIPLVQLITESGGNVPEWLTNWMITPAGQQVPGAAQGFTGAGYVNERTGVTPEVVRGVLRYFLSQRGST